MNDTGTSLVVQWLRLPASTAGGTGLIPGLGTTIPHAVRHGQKKKNEQVLIHSFNDYFFALYLFQALLGAGLGRQISFSSGVCTLVEEDRKLSKKK